MQKTKKYLYILVGFSETTREAPANRYVFVLCLMDEDIVRVGKKLPIYIDSRD